MAAGQRKARKGSTTQRSGSNPYGAVNPQTPEAEASNAGGGMLLAQPALHRKPSVSQFWLFFLLVILSPLVWAVMWPPLGKTAGTLQQGDASFSTVFDVPIPSDKQSKDLLDEWTQRDERLRTRRFAKQAVYLELVGKLFGDVAAPHRPRILVPCSGSSAELLDLSTRGTVTAIEFVQEAVERFIEGTGLECQLRNAPLVGSADHANMSSYSCNNGAITFLLADMLRTSATSWPQQVFDAIWDCAAFEAIEPKYRQAYVRAIDVMSSNNAKMLMVTHPMHVARNDSPPFLVTEVDIAAAFGHWHILERFTTKRNEAAWLLRKKYRAR